MPIHAILAAKGFTMPTREIVLTDHQEAFIGELLRSGRYKNASEVLRASLRLMQRHEQEDAVKLAILRRRLDVAEQDAENSRMADYTPTLLDEIDAEEREGFPRPGAK